MGTYRNFRITVIGINKQEVDQIHNAVSTHKELVYEDNLQPIFTQGVWSPSFKTWGPWDELTEISKQCKDTYILLECTENHAQNPYCQTIYYKGSEMDGEQSLVKRHAPISAVRELNRFFLGKIKKVRKTLKQSESTWPLK